MRHGPVDALLIKDTSGNGGGNASVKECPKCHLMVHTAVGEVADAALCEGCTNSGYDNDFAIVCNYGLAVGRPCAHYEGATDGDIDLSGVPF